MNTKLPAIIKKTLPAVVSIATSQSVDAIKHKEPELLFPFFEKDRLRTHSALKKISGKNLHISGGSGFIIDGNGLVVTNMHVIVHDHLTYTITLSDDTSFEATLVATDIIADVAFLQIHSKQKKFPFLQLADSSSLALGDFVLAIGNALGLFKNTISFGIVSGLSRTIEAHSGPLRESLHGLIQTDAAINPGNSGGPLIDMQGCVVGINAASVFEAENIGFAIPINTIKRDLLNIKKFGSIQRPFLGVRYMIVSDSHSNVFGYALVASPHPDHDAVVAGSPADRAGIRKGDVIVALDDHQLSTTYTIQDFLENAQIGQKITVHFMRKDRERSVSVLLEKRV